MRVLLLLLVATLVPAVAQPSPAERACAEGQFVRALTAQTLGDDSTAARVLDDLLSTTQDATLLIIRSEVAGDPTEAVHFARQAADLAAERADAHLALAAALRSAGQFGPAADALDAARRLAPADLDVLLAWAEVAAQQQDADAERQALAALVRLGDTVAARLRLSTLAEERGDRGDALAQAQAASRLAPSEPTVRRRLTDLQTESQTAPAPPSGAAGDIDSLLDQIDRNPRDLGAWVAVLDAMAASADARASATADEAMLLFSSVPAIVTSAADAYFAVGETEAGRAAAQRGLDALDRLGDALPDADALRARLIALLTP